MKKFCAVFALFCVLFLMISCGDGSSSDNNSVTNFGKLGGECYPNRTCDKGFICDAKQNVCLQDPGNPDNNHDKSDSDNAGKTDTTPEQPDDGDSTPDGSNSLSDNGDTGTNDDNTDTSIPDDNTDSVDDSAYSQSDADIDSGDSSNSGNGSGDSQPDEDSNAASADPCEQNNCLNDEHSDGVCTPYPSEAELYSCGCVPDANNNNYQWYSGKCYKVVSQHKCQLLAELALETFPVPVWDSTAMDFVCHCFSSDTCVALWEPE